MGGGEMASGSNTSFRLEDTLNPGFHRHAISFQPAAVNSTTEMLQIGNYYGMNSNPRNLMFCDSSTVINNGSPTSTTASNCSGSLLLDSVPGLKHDAGLAVEWTEEEQYKLEEGLIKYKYEPSILKYVKIAAILGDKTVRDVALRCQWMARKRRKPDGSNMLGKGNYRKDKFAESSSKTYLPSASIPTVPPYSFQQMDQNRRLKCQVLSSKANQLLEQNLQAFNDIDTNLTCLKLQENIDLLCQARENINNINAILNNMREFSGKMNQMQDLQISINENLANLILPRPTPINSFGMHNGMMISAVDDEWTSLTKSTENSTVNLCTTIAYIGSNVSSVENTILEPVGRFT